MKTIVSALILAMLFLVGACNKSGDGEKDKAPATKEEPEKKEAAGHAAKNVAPGSHEDWCEDHQVPESQCTRCDPTLTAAFKATGDWCEEHGVPESQCLKCNPDLKIVRPPKK